MSLQDRLPGNTDIRDFSPSDLFYPVALVAVYLLALVIRLKPRENMKYLQALDPYLIARWSHAIAETGSLPTFDTLRYFPYIMPTVGRSYGDKYIPALLYSHVVEPLFAVDFLTWTQVYPAIIGSLMVVAMYFIGKELFDKPAGLAAAFFLATVPGVLHRSSAGWFDKEATAGFLMLTSLYFVIRAWKRVSWPSGIIAGTALGISMMTWGGTKFLYYLFPFIAFITLFLNEDVRNLIPAFTPTLLIGHALPAILNPGVHSLWPRPEVMLAGGVLALIWFRYLIEQYELLEPSQYRLVTPATSVTGGFLLLLSPLYSQTLAGMMQGIINNVLQSGGAVVAGTVAENQPAQAGQILSQLGTASGGNVTIWSGLQIAVSAWTFAVIGTAAIFTLAAAMLLRKYDIIDAVKASQLYLGFVISLFVVASGLMVLLPSPRAGGMYALTLGIPLVLGIIAAVLLYILAPDREVGIERRWYLFIPLLWIGSTLWGVTQRSRLMFLAAQPVALMAGLAISIGFRELRKAALWEQVQEQYINLQPQHIASVVVLLLLIPVAAANVSAAQDMANGIGGSPHQGWMQYLDDIRENTPVNSVVMSWWDYGYWLQSIGARAAMADGGNAQFYRSAPGFNHHIINMPIADFFTASDYTEHMDFLKSYGADYVLLDSTMIGKYTAVSTIAKRGGQPDAMQTFRYQGDESANGRKYRIYASRGGAIYLPENLNAPPLLRTRQGAIQIKHFCSPRQGIVQLPTNEDRQTIEGCVALHPADPQRNRLLYIPPEVMESTLVNLYVMDAHNMPHFEEVFNNGVVKMWRINYDAE